MAATLTASTSIKLQSELMKMFPGATQEQNQYGRETPLANSLLGKQSMRSRPIMENGTCVGWDAWYTDADDIEALIPTVSTTASLVADCTIPTGSILGTKKVSYDFNMFIPNLRASISDDDCGNDLKFVTRMSETIAALVRKADEAVEKDIAARVFAQVSAPRAGDPNNSATYTVGATSIDVSAGSWTLNLLPKIMTTANYNRFGQNMTFWESGAFTTDVLAASFLSLNDDQRSLGALANAFNGILTSDTQSLFATLGAHGGLLINNDQFGFFNQTQYQNTTVSGATPDDQTTGFKVQSPRLKYKRNIESGDGSRSTGMAPVEYDVIYMKTCNAAASKLGWKTYEHRVSLRLTAGFVSAPVATLTGNANATGVIHYNKV